MMAAQVSGVDWPRLSDFIAASLGLHFPSERYADLRRGFQQAVKEFGFDDGARCFQWLLSRPLLKSQVEVLANHLTIGETYFFRDQPALDALANEILPSLLDARRSGDRCLRLWSAACCTGEEAYTLAILLHRLLPDRRDWQVTVTATDVNARFLRKAEVGVYGEWSFRDAPGWLRQGYFERAADGGYAVIPEIRKLVNFGYLNLADDAALWQGVDSAAMDVIFCRNALMYFTPAQMSAVVGKLRTRLGQGGWLVVSPSEASKALFPDFTSVNFPGAILFRKNDVPHIPAPAFGEPAASWMPSAVSPQAQATVAGRAMAESPAVPVVDLPQALSLPDPRAAADALFRSGRYREATDVLLAAFADPIRDPVVLALLAQSLANRGCLADALAWCDRWLTADKLDAAAHYLRAVILIEQDDTANAQVSLRRAIYLDGDFIMAHFALGNLARACGNDAGAKTYFANTQRLLRRYRPDELLPHSDGLTAGRFAETIECLAGAEQSS